MIFIVLKLNSYIFNLIEVQFLNLKYRSNKFLAPIFNERRIRAYAVRQLEDIWKKAVKGFMMHKTTYMIPGIGSDHFIWHEKSID